MLPLSVTSRGPCPGPRGPPGGTAASGLRRASPAGRNRAASGCRPTGVGPTPPGTGRLAPWRGRSGRKEARAMTTCELAARAAARRAVDATGRPADAGCASSGCSPCLYAGYSAARLLGDADLAGALANAHDLLAVERRCTWTSRARPTPPSRRPPLAIARATGTRCCTTSSRRPSWSGSTAASTATTARVRNALVVGSAPSGWSASRWCRWLRRGCCRASSTPSPAPPALGWWGSDASAPRGLGELTNQLAAMPSLHVGWAVWVAWVVCRLARVGGSGCWASPTRS